MRTYRDGWHTINGYEVWVSDGIVHRGTISDRNGNPTSAYPYRAVKDGWSREYKVSVDAFRAGAKRGTIKLM